MTANEQKLFEAARSLIDFAVKVKMWSYDHEVDDIPYDVRMDAIRALGSWDAIRGDIGVLKK